MPRSPSETPRFDLIREFGPSVFLSLIVSPRIAHTLDADQQFSPNPLRRLHIAALERGRTTPAKPAGGKGASLTLDEQVLALADGKTQQEITAACRGARPNHVGGVIARHKRAGRIELRDGKLYATQSAKTEQRAAV